MRWLVLLGMAVAVLGCQPDRGKALKPADAAKQRTLTHDRELAEGRGRADWSRVSPELERRATP